MLDNPTDYSKHLLIYDCDAKMDKVKGDFGKVRPKDIMIGPP